MVVLIRGLPEPLNPELNSIPWPKSRGDLPQVKILVILFLFSKLVV